MPPLVQNALAGVFGREAGTTRPALSLLLPALTSTSRQWMVRPRWSSSLTNGSRPRSRASSRRRVSRREPTSGWGDGDRQMKSYGVPCSSRSRHQRGDGPSRRARRREPAPFPDRPGTGFRAVIRRVEAERRSDELDLGTVPSTDQKIGDALLLTLLSESLSMRKLTAPSRRSVLSLRQRLRTLIRHGGRRRTFSEPEPPLPPLQLAVGLDASGQLGDLVVNAAALFHELRDLLVRVHHCRVIAVAEQLPDLG
ncbi:hypothetical protein EV639_10351 [Rathayibacter tanaceti]|uniref:Uncharacterized protein n=2 Tax=Rathayibacter tanaceti TaxID=1671680 RepID=A0ACD2XKL5_9MICO|nr:hypothetical protein ACH61_00369 [Rathayibacter tanaceti]TCO37867.1 hypothetical protein EV639_10351 [Rathayibacter tanaceti]